MTKATGTGAFKSVKDAKGPRSLMLFGRNGILPVAHGSPFRNLRLLTFRSRWKLGQEADSSGLGAETLTAVLTPFTSHPKDSPRTNTHVVPCGHTHHDPTAIKWFGPPPPPPVFSFFSSFSIGEAWQGRVVFGSRSSRQLCPVSRGYGKAYAKLDESHGKNKHRWA